SPVPSIDSYLITLLVETGIPGFLFFFGMIACGIWLGVRLYLFNRDEDAAVAGPIACSILAFAINRTVLSQRENQTFFFIIIGLVFVMVTLALKRAKSMERVGHEMRPQQARRKETPIHVGRDFA